MGLQRTINKLVDEVDASLGNRTGAGGRMGGSHVGGGSRGLRGALGGVLSEALGGSKGYSNGYGHNGQMYGGTTYGNGGNTYGASPNGSYPAAPYQPPYGGQFNQWGQQSNPTGSQLAVSGQQSGRLRGASAPPPIIRDAEGIPSDAPPTYEEASRSTSKPAVQASYPSQHAGQSATSSHHQQAPFLPFANSPHPPQQQQQQQQQQVPGIQPIFPVAFDVWWNTSNLSSKSELAVAGQFPHNPQFVTTLSLGWKGKMEVHQSTAGGPIIASGKSSNTDGTKQGLVLPGTGNVVELKWNGYSSKFAFTVAAGPNAAPDRFRWKKAQYGELQPLGSSMSSLERGFKLERESTGEVFAVFHPDYGFMNGTGKGFVEFVGPARAGVMGAHFCNVAVVALLKAIQILFIKGIASSVGGAAG